MTSMLPPRIRSPLIAAVCALSVAACARDPGQERLEGQEAPPAAAVVVGAGQESGALDGQLRRLQADLSAGLRGEPERLLEAEAVSDGLMEARRPFDWLATGYDVEARLRQLQAMADRIVAQLRRGADVAAVADDIEDMNLAVNDLRQQLAAGRGGPAPPTLDSLLAGDSIQPPPRGIGGRAGGTAAAPAGVPAAPAPADTAATPPAVAPEEDRGPLGRPVGG